MDRRRLDHALWACQGILAAVFCFCGMAKLGLPPDGLRLYFAIVDAPTWVVHRASAIEVAAALLVILPAVTRVLPRLSGIAAAAIAAWALLAVVTRATAGGLGVGSADLTLAALGFFVAWGRLGRLPVSPLLDEAPLPT